MNQPEMSSPYAALTWDAYPRRPISAIIFAVIGLFAGSVGLLWHGAVLMTLVHSATYADAAALQAVAPISPTIAIVEQAGLFVLSTLLFTGSAAVFAFAGGTPRVMTTYGGLALLFNLAAFCYTVATVDPSTLPLTQPITASQQTTNFYLYESADLLFGCIMPSLALIVFTRSSVRRAFAEVAEAQTLSKLPFTEDMPIRRAA